MGGGGGGRSRSSQRTGSPSTGPASTTPTSDTTPPTDTLQTVKEEMRRRVEDYYEKYPERKGANPTTPANGGVRG